MGLNIDINPHDSSQFPEHQPIQPINPKHLVKSFSIVSLLNSTVSLTGLPALVVAISVGFTKAKGYGTVN